LGAFWINKTQPIARVFVAVLLILFFALALFLFRKREKPQENIVITRENILRYSSLEELSKRVYEVDPSAFVYESDFPIEDFLKEDFTIDNISEPIGEPIGEPKILIFHTHGKEEFIGGTIIEAGVLLSEILAQDYGINVIHDSGIYGNYETMEPAVRNILEKFPSLEVAIDLHRDSVGGKRFVTTIEGRPTAKLMFFNGITRLNEGGFPRQLTELSNPYLKENLAFSLQMALCANEKYPGLCRKNYIKGYRYSLHMLPKSLLVEVGTEANTIEEANNAMYLLAEILTDVILKPRS
jgi:stage II sporulation protein P